MMQQKEMQIRRLQRELNAEKHLKMELEGEVQEQKKSVEKKGLNLNFCFLKTVLVLLKPFTF